MAWVSRVSLSSKSTEHAVQRYRSGWVVERWSDSCWVVVNESLQSSTLQV